VVVSGKLFSRDTDHVLLRFVEEFPGHDGFVTRTGNQHSGVLTVDGAGGGLETGYPIVVAGQVSQVLEILILLSFFH